MQMLYAKPGLLQGAMMPAASKGAQSLRRHSAEHASRIQCSKAECSTHLSMSSDSLGWKLSPLYSTASVLASGALCCSRDNASAFSNRACSSSLRSSRTSFSVLQMLV